MARTRRGAHKGPPRGEGREPAGPSAGGPLDVAVEEERLPDGRYVLYYTWPGPGAAGGRRAVRSLPAGPGAADDTGAADDR